MFLLKKIVGPFFDPLSICLMLFVIGLIMLWFTKRQRVGKVLVTIGLAILIIASYHWPSVRFIRPLESQHPALLQIDKASGVKWVVVLGEGFVADTKMPPNSQLSNSSLARLVEGIRIHKTLPRTQLVLSNGPGQNNISATGAMARTAELLGVDRQKLVLDSRSRDTEEQALFIKKLVGNDRFVLVTTASHIPRSVALLKKLGLHPIPAPTDHIDKQETGEINPSAFLPAAVNIMRVELAVHEYLGMLWANMRGRI